MRTVPGILMVEKLLVQEKNAGLLSWLVGQLDSQSVS